MVCEVRLATDSQSDLQLEVRNRNGSQLQGRCSVTFALHLVTYSNQSLWLLQLNRIQRFVHQVDLHFSWLPLFDAPHDQYSTMAAKS